VTKGSQVRITGQSTYFLLDEDRSSGGAEKANQPESAGSKLVINILNITKVQKFYINTRLVIESLFVAFPHPPPVGPSHTPSTICEARTLSEGKGTSFWIAGATAAACAFTAATTLLIGTKLPLRGQQHRCRCFDISQKCSDAPPIWASPAEQHVAAMTGAGLRIWPKSLHVCVKLAFRKWN